MEPTEEQGVAKGLFFRGHPIIKIEAGAGTGKTTTLRMLGESVPNRADGTRRRGVYVAFNKAIVEAAKRSMPRNVECSTAHALAMRAVGRAYAGRLNSSKRMRSSEIARHLGVAPLTLYLPTGNKQLAAGFLAGYVQRALTTFCQTADMEPGEQHFRYLDGIDQPDKDGRRTWTNNRAVRAHCLRALHRAWADAQNLNGTLPFQHGYYVKMWQLLPDVDGRPGAYIDADFIMFDEAQDASPVLLDVVLRQRGHARLVFVGDSNQQINEFTGAVNALARVPAPAEHTAWLTQSFRFGARIAGVANYLLDALNAEVRLTGNPALDGHIGPVEQPASILTRKNATAVEAFLSATAAGRTPWLIGGGVDVVRFAEAAQQLKDGERTYHPELACFETWEEVQRYVDEDEQGGELKLMVDLIDRFTPEKIIAALAGMPKDGPPEGTDLVVGTAHKAKGLEFDSVQLAGDFFGDDLEDLEDGELRLLYVACTRAKLALDITAVKVLKDVPTTPAPGAPLVDDPWVAQAATA